MWAPTEANTRGHVLVVMLAYMIVRELKKTLAQVRQNFRCQADFRLKLAHLIIQVLDIIRSRFWLDQCSDPQMKIMLAAPLFP
jgi:PHP family Zn ribbon phosphoesterase